MKKEIKDSYIEKKLSLNEKVKSHFDNLFRKAFGDNICNGKNEFLIILMDSYIENIDLNDIKLKNLIGMYYKEF